MNRPGTSSPPDRVLRVLQAIVDAQEPVTIDDLVSAVGLRREDVLRCVRDLLGTGLASPVVGTARYQIGPAAAGLERQSRRRDALRDAAMPVVTRLAAWTGETATLSARHGYERRYVGQVESRQPVRISVTVGERVPLVSGANGLAILAFLPSAEIEHVLLLPRPRWTARTTTDVGRIRARIGEIRERGYSRTDGERVRHSTSIAAPIMAPDGRLRGSLSVAYRTERAREDELVEIADAVVAAAAEASARLTEVAPGGRAAGRRDAVTGSPASGP